MFISNLFLLAAVLPVLLQLSGCLSYAVVYSVSPQATYKICVSWVLFCVRRAADARPCIPAGCSLDAQEPVRGCSDP